MVRRWKENMDRAEKDGKRRISGATKILDEAAEKGHVFDAKIIRSSAKESRAGQSPKKSGPKSVIPHCFWILLVTTI